MIYLLMLIPVAFAVGWTSGCTHEHKEVVRLEASIEADKQARIASALAEEKARAEAAIKADKAALRDKEDSDRAFSNLKAKHKVDDNSLSTLNADLLARLRDSIRTANASGPEAERPATSPAPTAAGPGLRGACFAAWGDKAAQLYRDCRERVNQLVKAWDDQVAIP